MSSRNAAQGGTCLFSAPFDFLPAELRSEYERLMPTVFTEIWRREDARPDPSVTAWVMNPGQSFVIGSDIRETFPNLQVLSTPSTGTNHIDVDDCKRHGIATYGLRDDRETLDSISASAEFTFLLLLASYRKLDVALAEVAAGRWRQREDAMRGNELAGKRVGLVGFGRIGRRMARYAEAFDARVRYYDPYVDDSADRCESLVKLFAESDVVCVCCVLTAETRGMIDYALLTLLPEGACLVNTSRGEVINEEDLARVLRERADLRAAVDVLTGEVRGTQYQSPLLAAGANGQILVTPHIAGATLESQTKAARGALRLLRRHFASA